MNLLSNVQTLLSALNTWLEADQDSRDPSAVNDAITALTAAFEAIEPAGRDQAMQDALAEDPTFTTASIGALAQGLIEFGTKNEESVIQVLAIAESIEAAFTVSTAADATAAAEAAAAEARVTEARESLARLTARFSPQAPDPDDEPEPPTAAAARPSTPPVQAAAPSTTVPVLDAGLAPANDTAPASKPQWQLHVGVGKYKAGDYVDPSELDYAFAFGLDQVHTTQKQEGSVHQVVSFQRPLDFSLSAAARSDPYIAGMELASRLSPPVIAAQTDQIIASDCGCDFTRLSTAYAPGWQDAGIDDYGLPRIGIANLGQGEGCKVEYFVPMVDTVVDSYLYPCEPGKVIDAAEGQKFGWTPEDGEKPCIEVPFPTKRTCGVDANTECFTWGYSQERFQPRALQMGMGVVKIALARRESRRWFESMSNLSISRTVPLQGGLGLITYYRELFKAFRREYVMHHRFPEEIVWSVSLPLWVADQLVLDLTLTVGDPDRIFTTGDIERIFMSDGFRLKWRREGLAEDNTEITVGAPGDPVQPTPPTVDALFWHDGAVAVLDGGAVNLGTIIDSALVLTNRRKSFQENWDGTCLFGFEPLKFTLPVCANGHNKAKLLEATCDELRLAA